MEPARFHSEPAHQERAQSRLPFAESDELRGLIATARRSAAQSRIEASPNPYALQPDTLGFVRALLDLISPSCLIEFGAGESTVVLAEWAAQHDARVVSLEHERTWVDKIKARLSPEVTPAVDLRHAPLKIRRAGLRTFLTYGQLDDLADQLAAAQFILVDGPHMSGREPVIHAVLTHAAPGALIVIDDFRHYAVREMLLNVPSEVASAFVGAAIDENVHGLYVLRCQRRAGSGVVPRQRIGQVLRSYWRCWRDFRQYGTGN